MNEIVQELVETRTDFGYCITPAIDSALERAIKEIQHLETANVELKEASMRPIVIRDIEITHSLPIGVRSEIKKLHLNRDGCNITIDIEIDTEVKKRRWWQIW